MALKPISVSQLNEYISRVLSTDPLLGNVSVTGEISNLKYHSSGHMYFSINDPKSKINCFFPASYVRNLDMEIKDGMSVTINGYVNVYKKGGTYTLFVRNILVKGEGDLAIAFQRMKEKLDKEGLFSQAHKKPLPKFPHHVGVITSNTGAAVRDIIKIIENRNNMVKITVFPVLVQGSGAAENMADTLDMINEHEEYKDLDVLIIGRGGGSAEDLWAFNEEILARAIYKSNIPIVSAVGHEIDFSISDFVADKRAETPTAAAEMVVPDLKRIQENLDTFKENLLSQLISKVSNYELSIENTLSTIKNEIDKEISQKEYEINTMKLYLDESNPFNILEKGYSMIATMEGKPVLSIEELTEGSKYRIRLKDGEGIFEFEGSKL